jgi:hypothetical protein
LQQLTLGITELMGCDFLRTVFLLTQGVQKVFLSFYHALRMMWQYRERPIYSGTIPNKHPIMMLKTIHKKDF